MASKKSGESTTPRTDIPFNFGQASSRDQILYTCERPGGDPDIKTGGKITLDTVQPQVGFMKKQGISQVLILLDDNELFEHYETADLLIDAYQAAGMDTHRQPMGESGAASNIMKIISNNCVQNNKIAAHCTHGMGRSGRVAAAWLSVQYKLDPSDATDEAMEYARTMGIERLGNAARYLDGTAVDLIRSRRDQEELCRDFCGFDIA